MKDYRDVNRDEFAKLLDKYHAFNLIPICELHFSVRLQNCLSRLGLISFKDVLRMTDSEFCSIKGNGRSSLFELKSTLEDLGFSTSAISTSSLSSDQKRTMRFILDSDMDNIV